MTTYAQPRLFRVTFYSLEDGLRCKSPPFVQTPKPQRISPPEDNPTRDTGGCRPFINRIFHPLSNGNGPNVPVLAHDIHNAPPSVSQLDVIESQVNYLLATQAGAAKDSEE